MNLVAVDVGFNRTKFRNGERRLSFASVVGRPETGGVGYSLAGNGLKIRIGDAPYWTPFGETALKRQRQATGRRDGSWVLSDEWLALFLGAVGQLVEGDATVRLVTGLPVNDHERFAPLLRERLLKQSFTFQLHGSEPQTVKINAVKIPPQPIGSLFSVAFDAYGNAKENAFSTEMGVIIDVGGHTVNTLVVDGLATVAQSSRPLGLLYQLDDVARLVNEDYPSLEFTTHDVAVALEKSAFWNGRFYEDIDMYVSDYLSKYTSLIAQFIRNEAPRASRLHWLLLTGGGVEAIGEQLVKDLRHDYGHVRIAEDPMWANASGYLALARRATKQGLW